MPFQLTISPDAEAKLRERAAAAGMNPIAYAAKVLEERLAEPELEGLLILRRGEVAHREMSDEQREDQADIAAAERVLADPDEKPIPFEPNG